MDHSNINASRLLPWLLALSTGLIAGCADAPKAPLTTLGQLPAFEKIKDKLEALNLTLPKPEFNIDAARFVGCMAPLTSRLEPGLAKVLGEVEDKTDELKAKLDTLGGLDDRNLLGKQSLIADLLDKLTTSPHLEGPAGLAQKIKDDLAEHRKHFKQRVNTEKEFLEADTRQALKLEEEYLKAYFKKGGAQLVSQIIQDPAEQTELQRQAASLLKLKTDDPKLEQVLVLFDKQLGKAASKLAKKSPGFVGRDGTQYGFPGIVETGTHVSIDHSQVAADTLRIALEAVRDHYAPLPVLPNTNASASLTDYVIDFSKPVHWVYDRRAGTSADISIDEAGFQEIEAHSRKAEASVAGAVGKAIRGGSWGALNNEAVAKLVETAAGVVARHVTERAQWCVKAQAGEAHATTP
ncbi:hypothetical protein [Methylomonas sp. UP202]|uniref:hypothetical protein n=1 Tax=Methylomonas sp. UP202 TaxID=3040943 RepID=UPI00247B1B15|nr:hypothetical protein [Methylomonas sp. UP202]WGS87620.1 hypothetical protein QC632_07630 [Methylomonas sp. UP202]